MRTKPFHECNRSEKRSQGYWLCPSYIHRNDPAAKSALYDLDRRLDYKGYSGDLRQMRRSVHRSLGAAIYMRHRQGGDTLYETPVHIYASADVEGGHVIFDVKVSFEQIAAPEGYDYVGVFPAGDAHSKHGDLARDDSMYRDYVWPFHYRADVG